MGQGLDISSWEGAFSRLVYDAESRWHCLRTRARQDRVLARELAELGLRVFAPVAVLRPLSPATGPVADPST